jgi:hypothetical protein
MQFVLRCAGTLRDWVHMHRICDTRPAWSIRQPGAHAPDADELSRSGSSTYCLHVPIALTLLFLEWAGGPTPVMLVVATSWKASAFCYFKSVMFESGCNSGLGHTERIWPSAHWMFFHLQFLEQIIVSSPRQCMSAVHSTCCELPRGFTCENASTSCSVSWIHNHTWGPLFLWCAVLTMCPCFCLWWSREIVAWGSAHPATCRINQAGSTQSWEGHSS